MARSKQLLAEITAALAAGTPHPEATAADWRKRISAIQAAARRTGDPAERQALQHQLDAANDGLRAAQRSATSPVTHLNVFALKELVLDHGPEFSARVPRVDAPHLRRAIDGGLAEVIGSRVRLTSRGRDAVVSELEKDLDRERSYRPRESTLTAPEHRAAALARDTAAHDAKVAKIETALVRLR